MEVTCRVVPAAADSSSSRSTKEAGGSQAQGSAVAVGLWARSAKRPPVLVLALMLVIVIMFILLTGAPQDFSASRWAWLLTSFAGGTIGASAGERLAAARRSKATGKATSRRRP